MSSDQRLVDVAVGAEASRRVAWAKYYEAKAELERIESACGGSTPEALSHALDEDVFIKYLLSRYIVSNGAVAEAEQIRQMARFYAPCGCGSWRPSHWTEKQGRDRLRELVSTDWLSIAEQRAARHRGCRRVVVD